MRVKEKFPVDPQMIQRTGVLFGICEWDGHPILEIPFGLDHA
jgi:hypothetical protein